MSRTFAEWLTDSRAKTLLCVFVAAVFTPSVPFALWVPGALLVLLSLVPSAVPPLSGLFLAAAAIVRGCASASRDAAVCREGSWKSRARAAIMSRAAPITWGWQRRQ